MSERKPNSQCSVCQKAIYRRPRDLANAKSGVYCGRECYGKASRQEIPCVVCGKPILAGLHKKTCSQECATTHLSNPNRLHSKGRRPGKSRRTSTRTFRARLLATRGNKCQLCGYDRHNILNIHHIIERCNGGTDDESNLLLICPNCHTEVHKGFRMIHGELLEPGNSPVC